MPPSAQHGLDAIAAEPAQLPGFLRRSEEIQRQRFTARHTFRGLGLLLRAVRPCGGGLVGQDFSL